MAQKDLKKCPICKKIFDIAKEPYQKVGKRYCHQECFEKNGIKISSEDSFYQYIGKKFGKGYDFVRIRKQAEKYIKDYGFKYSGMEGALRWFFDVQGNPVPPDQTIGIIPWIYEQAKDFYLEQDEKKENATGKIQVQTEIITIQSPRTTKRLPRKWNFDGGEDEA